MIERDQQRSRVYAAEALVQRIFDRADRSGVRTIQVHGSTLTLPIERRFASIESMQRCVDLVLQLNWVKAAWADRAAVPVTVRERRGQARAHYERATATIAIPPHHRNRAWAMREFVVLHELAHHLEPDATRAAHGPTFTDRLRALVGQIIGPEAGLVLDAALHDNGVRVGVRRGVEM